MKNMFSSHLYYFITLINNKNTFVVFSNFELLSSKFSFDFPNMLFIDGNFSLRSPYKLQKLNYIILLHNETV